MVWVLPRAWFVTVKHPHEMWGFYPYETVRFANLFVTVKHPHEMWEFYPYEANFFTTDKYPSIDYKALRIIFLILSEFSPSYGFYSAFFLTYQYNVFY